MSVVCNCKAFSRRRMRTRWFFLMIVLLGSTLVSGAGNDCTFLNDPDHFANKSEQRQKVHSDLAGKIQNLLFSSAVSDATATVDPSTIARKNFIDDSTFGRMSGAGIQSAPIASDVEFLRRVTLDLTGRIPSGVDVDSFLA